MSDAIKESGSVVFSDFVADLRTQELRKDGVVVRLPAQSFQVLRLLLQRPGELVSRQALQRGLWPNDAFGDFEHGLNAAVNRLREALGDSADVPRFIETLPRRGYRFIGETAAYGEADQSDPPLQPSQGVPPEIAAGVIPTPARRLSWGRIQIAILIALAVAMASALLLWRQQRSSVVRPASQASQPQMVVTPLTALPGMKFAPTFSPDGSQVAFAWDGGKTEQSSPYDLYVKVVGSERLQQITHKPSSWLVPAWSPDGRNIAFARNGEGLSGIFVVSALGGPNVSWRTRIFSSIGRSA